MRTTRITGFVIALGLVLGSFQLAQAAAPVHSVQAKSGQLTHIWNFFLCTRSRVPAGANGFFVEHGTVTIKDVTQNRCGSANWPAREVWYTSPPGFRGVDTITFPMGQSAIILNVAVE